MQRIDMVVFDLGNVVCHFLPERRTAALAKATGLADATVEASIWTSGLDAAFDRGEFDPDGAVSAARAALHHRLDRTRLLSAWADAFVVDESVVEIARSLACPAAIFTNNGPLLELCCANGILDLRNVFNPLIFSWRLGHAKPDPLAYQAAANRLQISPERLLFVDDSLGNVCGAAQAGWQSRLYEGADPLGKTLCDMGLC